MDEKKINILKKASEDSVHVNSIDDISFGLSVGFYNNIPDDQKLVIIKIDGILMEAYIPNNNNISPKCYIGCMICCDNHSSKIEARGYKYIIYNLFIPYSLIFDGDAFYTKNKMERRMDNINYLLNRINNEG